MQFGVNTFRVTSPTAVTHPTVSRYFKSALQVLCKVTGTNKMKLYNILQQAETVYPTFPEPFLGVLHTLICYANELKQK